MSMPSTNPKAGSLASGRTGWYRIDAGIFWSDNPVCWPQCTAMQSGSPPPVTSSNPSAARRRVRRYRIAGLVLLFLGLAGAGFVYWRGTQAAESSDDPAMVGFNRRQERQMGLLYGKQGRFIEDLSNSLQQPGTQAVLIAAAAAVVAAGCFRFASILEHEAQNAACDGAHQN